MTHTDLRDSYREQTPDTRRAWAAATLANIGKQVDPLTRRWLKRLATGRYSPVPLHILGIKAEQADGVTS